MRYPCLVLDHDDTVVNSTACVHFPCFVEYMAQFRPEVHYTLEEYFLKNFDPGVYALFHDLVGLSDEEMEHEQAYWRAYVRTHVSTAFDGMRELLWDYKRAGGHICVSSHSYSENILRDYRENGLPEPELIFGWELPREKRKPEPYSLLQILDRYGLPPREVLMVDDLKPGYDMARACGVPFAAAGWANDIPEIESFMRRNCDHYCTTVAELRAILFDN